MLLKNRHHIVIISVSMQGNFEKPDEEELAQTAKETAAALNLVVTNKLAAAQPKNLPKQPGAATYIKYTPQQQGPQYASGARERTIKMQDMPVDPMEPPKFRHKKVSKHHLPCRHHWVFWLQVIQYPLLDCYAHASWPCLN